jgi:TPR repeat protein
MAHPDTKILMDQAIDLWNQKHYSEALTWIQQAYELGHPLAAAYLGRTHYNGCGVTYDWVKARQLLAEASAQGVSAATHNLGTMYYLGEGGSADYTKARELYELATAQGETAAFTSLGLLYEQGLGVPQDYTKARELYELTISKCQQLGIDSLKAPLELADLYAKGHGVHKDHKTDIRILVEALARPENQVYRDRYRSELRQLIELRAGNTIIDTFVRLQTENNQLRKDQEQLNHEVEALRLELTYRPGGEGYQQAKDHFDSLTQPRPNQMTTN